MIYQFVPHRLPVAAARRLFGNGLQLGFIYENKSDQRLQQTFNL